jgi:flagellar biogenesis protein FliO
MMRLFRQSYLRLATLCLALLSVMDGYAADARATRTDEVWSDYPEPAFSWQAQTEDGRDLGAPESIAAPVSSSSLTPTATDQAEPDAISASSLNEPLSTTELNGLLNKMVWGAGTLGIFAMGALWLGKMWLAGRKAQPSELRSLRIIETLRVGPRSSLYLVEADAHRILVGFDAAKGMTLLSLPAPFTEDLDEAETPNEAVVSEQTAEKRPRLSETPSLLEVLQTRGLWPAGRAS